MAADNVDIVLRLRRSAQFQKDAAASRKAVDKTEESVKRTGRTMRRSSGDGRGFGTMLTNLRRPLALVTASLVGGVGLIGGVHKMVDEWRESNKVQAQTNAVMKSTKGAANITSREIGGLANRLSLKAGIDDEAIQQGANMLLTFKNIRNEVGKGNKIFDQSTKAVLDMAVGMKGGVVDGGDFGTSMRKASIGVGKALNDPIKGITALGRVGVTFTEQQKDQIKALVESGDRMAAQKIILRELNSEFGGSAAAVADPWDKAKRSMDELFESMGTAIGPTMATVMIAIGGFVTQMDNGTGAGGDLVDVLSDIAGYAVVAFNALGGVDTLNAVWDALQSIYGAGRDVVQMVIDVVNGFKDGKTWALLLVGGLAMLTAGIVAYNVVVGIASLATRIWAGAQMLLNIAMSLNPIGLVIGAIVALIVIFVLAYKKVEWFRNGVNKAWEVIKTVFKWSPLGLVVRNFGAIVGFVKGLPGKIASAAKGMWRGIQDGFKSVINWLLGAWNKLDFGISIKAPDWVPGIGGKGFEIKDIIPDIPLLASGGVVSGMGSWISGEAGPELNTMLSSGQVRVEPLSGGDLAGAVGGAIVIENVTYLDGEVVARSTNRYAADEHARRRG